jgi:hypothetical protein
MRVRVDRVQGSVKARPVLFASEGQLYGRGVMRSATMGQGDPISLFRLRYSLIGANNSLFCNIGNLIASYCNFSGNCDQNCATGLGFEKFPVIFPVSREFRFEQTVLGSPPRSL